MKSGKIIAGLIAFLMANGCITQFVPETDEEQELLVVEGLITDQHEVNTIKLSKSMPLGSMYVSKPLGGCDVVLSDDSGNSWHMHESSVGKYITDTSSFRGIVGRKYKLTVHTNSVMMKNYSYESFPIEMKPVPPIDSIYWEKITIRERTPYYGPIEGCQIYLNTEDPSGNCKYYRWDFTETWRIGLPFAIPVNKICWITYDADVINIKSTSALSSTKIDHYPIRYISNQSDRLSNRYSILINQYSLNEEEFTYWEKLQSITENVGSLYDIIPASINSNMFCIEDPSERVLGYFSVSAKTQKRIFIRQNFAGLANPYANCVSDTIYNNAPIPNLNAGSWKLDESVPHAIPIWVTVTNIKGCADCTVRGTTVRPDFWEDDN